MQTTLKGPVSFTGQGLHSGRPAKLTLRPAAAEYGIWFSRTDVAPGTGLIAAHWDAVEPSQLCTRIVNAHGVSVSTIEHVMAAVAGCGLQNLLIEVDGPEVPILDGSAAPFVARILARGLRRLDAPIRALQVLKPVEVRKDDAFARLSPSETLEIDFHIDFPDAAIGVQDKHLNMANGAFVHELCDSRTFCRRSDVEAMRAQGLALGGTLENAVVVDGAQILSPGGLRHEDEAVRHKMLDALGDLALAGAPLLARYSGFRAGHAMTNALLRKLFDTPGACRMVTCDTLMSARLPGAGLRRADAPRHA
ncbi:UDP-3-O-acyl-N-acetylglucosamine deacetylase [Oceaniglobus roseus]|uniref:UDP-3-O-acyl-N-acetylglucosamine deacetylase n=1 Tax=Oceaniglobus roseus TaxID=1737570 RepID=UPI000C7EF0D4|nr:UDP-3-O-acyl-N-acetylglucosamine deacetylase [Kandeliimicrobium roseum]